ncbi:DsbA family protein [Pseudomonas sp. RC10]|uniref:2-hydroxychromene-2-carboxylate isomerase n=1 Tax=Pseudomonas bambusae TaxID=3139142 RepID=UPI003138F878
MLIDILIASGLAWPLNVDTSQKKDRSMQVQFVFDYRSPYSYLANARLTELEHGVEYLPVDVLAVMKKVNNQPSPACPVKAKYAMEDAARWAKVYDVPLKPNMDLFKALRTADVDGSLFSRAGLAALKTGVFEAFHTGLFHAVWAGEDDLVSVEGRSAFLKKLGLDVDVWSVADTADIREQIEAHNESSAHRGVFGVPSFVCADELFFGNDRLNFVIAKLNAAKEA